MCDLILIKTKTVHVNIASVNSTFTIVSLDEKNMVNKFRGITEGFFLGLKDRLHNAYSMKIH